ncbi:hypothetical protein BDFB_013433 [Asbolus verrucosus]|uniref:Uncharacterized protein n=1 Tax=Asbolus verrucosus TaxID=1661398 RepID=A0A482VPM9_ASBVE|nr:hypothetical protein BDFB_013433 [Asbolus verrucosus]
MSQARHLRW